MQGFFTGSELTLSKPPISLVPKCGACGLYKTCKSPKMPFSGAGKRKILIVGEAPGEQEDEQGEPFVGPAGRELKSGLAKAGVDLRRDCWITNSLICRPPENKTPSDAQIGYCLPNVIRVIKELKPEIILPLGNIAIKSVIGWLWKEDVGKITRWIGWNIPCQKLNAWICPAWHPSYVMRSDYGVSGKRNEVRDMIWLHHIKQAVRFNSRPWDEVPDYQNQIELIHKPDDAVKLLKHWHKKGGTIAFDYETNMLKPDSPKATIVSCSVCWKGKRTIAFPWYGDVVEVMSKLLRDERIPKVAQNLKFENRWTKRLLGHWVKGWLWDTMIGAHICDNRRHITGLKFQAFVWLGVDSYDDHIKPYLQAKSDEVKVNRILEEIDIDHLLLYNGLDSLLEYKLAILQNKFLKYDFSEMRKRIHKSEKKDWHDEYLKWKVKHEHTAV
jgi:uracil-DNA glycosylase